MNDYNYNSYDDMAYETDAYAYYWDLSDLEEADNDNSIKNKKYL